METRKAKGLGGLEDGNTRFAARHPEGPALDSLCHVGLSLSQHIYFPLCHSQNCLLQRNNKSIHVCKNCTGES
jgi:hypothetical protein